jgi:chemosensory pili system protein ChpC
MSSWFADVEIAAPQETEVLCVMVPVMGARLLVPNVTVAEILPSRRINARADLPDWCVGSLAWRGLDVPVIRFDVLNGATPASAQSGRCILILNRVRHEHGCAFYGLLADGLPRLLHLGPGDVENSRTPLGPAEVAAVKVGTETAVIPNLTYIEESLAQLGDLPASEC